MDKTIIMTKIGPISKEFLENEYITKNKSKKEIAKELNFSTTLLARCFRVFGIPNKKDHLKVDISEEKFFELYCIERKTCHEIAKLYGCSCNWIVTKKREYGFKPSNKKKIKDEDFINKRFGKLVVLGKTKDSTSMWDCQCDCGNIVSFSRSSINNGPTGRRTCKCSRNINPNKIPRFRFTDIINSATHRHIEFSISIEYAQEIFDKQQGKCKLTKIPIQFGGSRGKNKVETTASLDRIDSNKGYIEGNVQWVHRDINQMKWKFSQEKFIEFCKLVASNN